jgi:hypothetical protein
VNLDEFKKSLSEEAPPENINDLLLSLWFDAKGNWNKAHEIAQEIESKDTSLVHAYLHRKEGDEWNASYWYNRSGKSKPDIELSDEWDELVKEFLNK